MRGKFGAPPRLSICFLFLALFAPLAGQEAEEAAGSIPDVIIRPNQSGEPVYPRDTIIGELGAGEAPAGVYRLARNILSQAQRRNAESPLFAGFGAVRLQEIFSGIEAVGPDKFRIGGGKIMPDGAVSFLFRFIGREKGVAGELFLRREHSGDEETGPWLFDDMILDEAHDTQIRREVYKYDFTPYERFY
jgi:hypothetical protein